MVPPDDSGYSRESDYVQAVGNDVRKRSSEIAYEIEKAFGPHIEAITARQLVLKGIPEAELAQILMEHPRTVKPLIVLAGVAGRAIERDLGIKNLNTYNPRLTAERARLIASYIIPLLPERVSLEALVEVDRVAYLDSAKRMWKGAWEKRVTKALIQETSCAFEKRKIVVDDEEFEIDAAYPGDGDIRYAVDVKRIEARKDYQKRADEIVNKAKKLKRLYPNAKFAAVVYYPFEHDDVVSRLRSDDIDAVLFAADSDKSIAAMAQEMASALAVRSSSR